MNKYRKQIILFVFSTVALLWIFSSGVISLHSFNNYDINLRTKISENEALLHETWLEISESQGDKFELNVEIVGYKLISTNINPMKFDEEASIYLIKDELGYIDLIISSKFGIYEYEDVIIRGHLVMDQSGNYFVSYNIDSPREGFFMDLLLFPDYIELNLAFDGGDGQLCYLGFLKEGYTTISPLYPHLFEKDQINSKDIALSKNELDIDKETLINNLKDSVIVYNEKYLSKLTADQIELTIDQNEIIIPEAIYPPPDPGPIIDWTGYGFVHEYFDFNVDYPEELPDDYWEPYTEIDIGIHRLEPSEALVKSDLQYYNKYYVIQNEGYNRDILAYTMGAHGGPYWYNGIDFIEPNEIASLWYISYNPSTGESIIVKPIDTIILSDSCFGYGDPTMAKAFVDYGADAFIGATIKVPFDSDSYMRAFWNDLCQLNKNVRDATITLCNTHGEGWNLGDEWRIYGDQYAKLE